MKKFTTNLLLIVLLVFQLLVGCVSSPNPGGVGPTLRSAVLGYSYFKEMKRDETKFIHAFVSVNNPASKVRDTLSFLNESDGLEKGNDTTSVFTRNMAVYKYVRIVLVNGEDSGFKITQIHDSARQEIDSMVGNHWEWAITPITNEKTGLLILKVVAETPDGSEEAFNAQSIPIKVELDLNLFRRVWNYLSDNPSVLLTAILIPVVAFFGRRLFGKKKGE